MAVIRLEFDVDSDVHPELYAMLASIASPAARGERLRQLAATGLVWEKVRLQEPSPPARARAVAAVSLTTAPAEVPADPLALREFEHEIESVVRELPELFDVLEEHDLPRSVTYIGKPRAVPPSVPVLVHDVPAEEPPPAADEVPPAPAPRSRLMRMKDKGLFKNE